MCVCRLFVVIVRKDWANTLSSIFKRKEKRGEEREKEGGKGVGCWVRVLGRRSGRNARERRRGRVGRVLLLNL